jgi:hypothetical protein
MASRMISPRVNHAIAKKPLVEILGDLVRHSKKRVYSAIKIVGECDESAQIADAAEVRNGAAAVSAIGIKRPWPTLLRSSGPGDR